MLACGVPGSGSGLGGVLSGHGVSGCGGGVVTGSASGTSGVSGLYSGFISGDLSGRGISPGLPGFVFSGIVAFLVYIQKLRLGKWWDRESKK